MFTEADISSEDHGSHLCRNDVHLKLFVITKFDRHIYGDRKRKHPMNALTLQLSHACFEESRKRCEAVRDVFG